MLEFYAGKFLAAYAQVAGLAGFAQHAINDSGGFGVIESGWRQHQQQIEALVLALTELELPVSRAAALRALLTLEAAAKQEHATIGNVYTFSLQQAREFHGLISETNSRVHDELGSRFLLSISPQKAPFFVGEKSAFGTDISTKFPSLQYEVAEAGKCYALERSTACAFHSIRCLEAGIRAIARCLQIPDPTKGSQRSWANILRTVKDRMDARWPTQADRFSGDGRLFEDLYAGLNAMQNPWRNATMHLDQKYTEDEAKYLMETIGGFMNRIASRRDENGQPFA